MPRRVEDIVRTDRRTVRDIPVEESSASGKRRSDKPAPQKEEKGREIHIHKLDVTVPIHTGPKPSISKRRTGTSKKKGVWWVSIIAAVVLIVAGAGYVASTSFARAKFTIVPVVIPVTADTTIVATGTTTAGYLSYKAVPYSESFKKTIPAKSGPKVSTKAAGAVMIYNSYSRDPQKLVAGSRLSTDSGLVYRLGSSVVVPGYTVNSKGTIVAGSLKASVTADAAGASYNLSRGDGLVLHFPAYKGTPRYSAVSAQLSTDIAGGFIGEKKIVDQRLLASTTAELQASLTAELVARAKAGVPEGYIMYDGAYKAYFAPADLSGTSTDSAILTVKGTLYSVLFRQSDLVAKLAGSDKASSFSSYPYRAPGAESLSFTINNPKDFSPAQNNALIAHFKGDIELVGIVPTDALKAKLAGKPLSATLAVLKSYSSVIDVSKSAGELFPSWANGVPTDLDRISVVVEAK